MTETSSRQALIVAIDEYADPGLRRLQAPARDAEVLAEVLGNPGIGDFEVKVLRNAGAQDIRFAVEDFFADRRPDDLLLLHFSCHGLKSQGGELFLAAADSRPTRLASTAVAADFVNQQMADSRAQRIVLFLDCCYGGAFPRGMVVRGTSDVQVGEAFAPAQEAAGGRGRVVVTASSAVEYAFEGGELAAGASVNPSVFTGSLVEGLSTGEADRDGDGWVGLNELFSFVAERVRKATPNQTPHLWAFGSEGDLLLAHSRRRRIVPDPLPPELVEAASSPLAATRLGVAVELRERLHGDNLGQAFGSWQLLTRMAEDDSRRVAGAVHGAMESAVLKVSPDALDLGQVQLGDVVSREVHLTGSPLALVASADSPDEWLQVEVDDSRLRVTATPEGSGPQIGGVVVSTPIGDHVLPVRIEVVDPERVGETAWLPAGDAPPSAVPHQGRAKLSGRRISLPTRPEEPVRNVPTPELRSAVVPAPAVAPGPAPFAAPGPPAARVETRTSAAAEPGTPSGSTPAVPRRTVDQPRHPDKDEPGPGERCDGVRPLWWPLAVGLLLAAAGLFVAVHTLESLWGNQSSNNVAPQVIDARSAIAVVLFAGVLVGLRWRRLAVPVLGAAAGVALYFLQEAALLLVPSSGAWDDDRPNWELVVVLGVVVLVLVAGELRRRRLLVAEASGRTPPVLAVVAYVLGGLAMVLATTATRNGSTSALAYVGGIILLVPGVTLLLTGLPLFGDLRAEPRRVAVAAAVAFLVAGSLGTADLALRSGSDLVPFGVPAFTGAGLMLIALAVDARRPRRA
ncbi:caspase family protein [Pengzhenrongella sp.]|jgi:hypothetical protein|uniref:caspase family protein n=1 Tax=Pengzhenrongella sp. TaxID=2888820 RepID=UPI002F957C23